MILVYATPDGRQYLRRERALTSFSDDRPTTAAVDARPGSLGEVSGPERREAYAAAVDRTRERYDPNDEI